MKMDGDPFIFYFTFLKLINIWFTDWWVPLWVVQNAICRAEKRNEKKQKHQGRQFYFSSTIYRQKYIANFDNIAILCLHSCMIALEPITTSMYPSTSVTINCKFICRACMYFWSSLLLFLTSKSSKDCSVFVSMEFLTWLTMSIYFLSWYIFICDSPICRYYFKRFSIV